MVAPFDPDKGLDQITSTDPDTLADRARDIAARRGVLDAEEAELLATGEDLRVGGIDWFRDPGAWLRNTTGIAGHSARTRLTVARGLAVLPTVLDALRNGDIGFDHARLIADQADSPNRDNLLADIDEILAWAVAKSADDFRDALAGWARDLDERREAGMTDHQRQRRRRKVRRSRTKDGLRRTTLELDEETDALVYGAVRDIFTEMLRAENKARKAAGDKADLRPENHRATPEIWADAFGELARRSRAADVITKHKARPTILAMTEMSVLWDQLKVKGFCELADGTKLTSAQIRRMACEADIIPMVMDTNGVCLDMGETVRLATYKQRLALRAIHATCAVEGCDMDFDWCEIHHLKPWEKGGLTDLDNLVPLCSYHHHPIHDCDTQPEILPNRTLRVVPIALPPAPHRPRPRDPPTATSPPDLVPTRG